MCGRYSITISLDELLLFYHIADSRIPQYRPRYNISPGQPIPAIIHDGERNRLGELSWGLTPARMNQHPGKPLINARSETVHEKPAFRELLRGRRCLIPADGFYEWQVLADGSKQPMRIVRKDRLPFAMAALYDIRLNPDGKRESSCVILTTAANDLMSPIHHRMPVILEAQAAERWLNRGTSDPRELQPLLRPCPDDWLEAYPVDRRVGRTQLDDPSCIMPL
ncbi:SOS response-associated peptidase [Paenibacillus sp. 1P07SE]|uniref:SOS response-associated peptidase n=1 Tax=Paenibacillus sp. 1P07SE TaxID=3132209 RepID=UPI0039A597DB